MQFSHHSSNPLELHTSDATGARYRQNVANAMHGDSSDELGRWSDKTAYQSHVSRVVGVNLGTLVIPPYRGRPTTPVAGPSRQLVQEYVDLDDDMESEDELATPFKEDYTRSTREASKNAQRLFDDEGIVVDEEVLNDEDAEGEDEQIVNPEEVPMEEDGELAYVEQTWEDDMQPEDYGDIEDDEDAIMSPLTPLSDDEDGLNSIQFHPEWSSPQSSRPPSPDETRTLFSRSLEEQAEIQEEMQDLCENVPVLAENYELLDRLGTGTFSSVYKALDLKYDEYDNHAWQGTHPANSSAYYQRAGPSYRGRGGRRSTKEEAAEEDEENENEENQHHGGVNDGKAFVAIKRIYTTSGPDRIKNEVAIMEDCRGARHVSQIITAFRELDQVVIVLPYQRNLDFRDYFQTLHPEGIKCYFRCLFRALNDIHRRGIIHRDVKPANFLFDPFTGIGTLCDFGLASRMETPPHVGECLHRPWSEDHPHGQNYSQSEQDIERIKRAQRKARNNSRNPPEKVGYPENDRRPISKANRAGTRGFRAPEVLLKCGAQTGAIDVWSAGIILLFFLTGKFPIFQSNDDIEGLMEIAVIIGKKKLEMAATLHGRIVSTNVPGLETEGINWQTFVERLNPEVGTPKKYDMRFYPHNCKHRDGPTSSLRAAAATQQQQVKTEEDPPAPDRLADALAEAIASVKAEQVEEDADVKVKVEPASTPAIPPPASTEATTAPTAPSTTTAPSPSDRYANPRAPEIHKRDMKHAFYLLEKVLNVEATKRYTPGQALGLAWLEEPAIGPDSQFVPLLPGEGVCRRWHHHDAARRVDQVFVRRVCRCSELEERRLKELEREEKEQEERVRWMEEAEKEEQEEQEEKLQILGSDGEVLSSEADPLQFPERESSPTVTESKILDVFDDEYELAVDPRLERLPVKRCCERTIVRDLVAGEGISFGDEPCEFHTDDFYRNQFIYRVAEDV